MKNSLKYVSVVICFSIPILLTAQDLVKNPSFNVEGEQPTGWKQIDRTGTWSNANSGTVDLFSNGVGKCAKDLGIPSNKQGEQGAFDGGSYAGIIAFQDDEVINVWPSIWENQEFGTSPGYGRYSEYITTELTAPLVAGKVYRISYQVSLSEKSSRAISNLGAYVSDVPVSENGTAFLDVKPSFIYGAVIKDKDGWTKVSGTFTAKGGEKYLTIGVMNHGMMEVEMLTDGSSNDSRRAYYYVDGLSMLPAEGVDFNTILNGDNVILTKLLFDTGKSTIQSSSYPQLDEFANWLIGHPSVNVSIDGHTDKSGSDEFNLNLSKERAEAVKTYLIQKGVSDTHLITRGYGDSRPLDTSSLENNPKNRRVEISLSK